jgi:hypothetical protein
MPARVHPEVARLAKTVAGAEIALLVRVAGDPHAVAKAMPAGARVRHVFTLSPGLAITAPANLVPQIAAVDAVISVEPDREVKTQ